MREEIIAFLKKKLQGEYEGRDFKLAYVLMAMRMSLSGWLFNERLDPNTYSQDEQTLLIIEAICDNFMSIN